MTSDTEESQTSKLGDSKPDASKVTPNTLFTSPAASLTTGAPVVLTGLELRTALSDALKEHGLVSVGDTARAAQGEFK